MQQPADLSGEKLEFFKQINELHTALFGWPCDRFTPVDTYLGMGSIQEVARAILKSDRFRRDIRSDVPLLPRDKWVMTEYGDFKIWINLLDSFVSFDVLNGGWDVEETAFMRSCLRPGDGVIDLGAQIGVYSLHAAAAVGDSGKVYAFEPNEPCFQRLKQTIALNGFEKIVEAKCAAVGAKAATAFFQLSDHIENPGNSYITQTDTGHPVPVVPLDAIEFGRPIRFIKMDVEGSEPFVLEGGRETIARHRPVILAEMNPDALRRIGRPDLPGFFRQWKEIGYSTQRFEADGSGEFLGEADAGRFENMRGGINLICRPL